MQIRLKVTSMEDFCLTCFSLWSQVPQTLMTDLQCILYIQVTVNYKLPLFDKLCSLSSMYKVGRQNLHNIYLQTL